MELKETIYDILLNDEISRDNDNYLVTQVWKKEIEKLDIGMISLYRFFEDYSNKEFSNHDNITRIRRKLQEEFFHLRGEKYQLRQNKTHVIKKDLRKNSFFPKKPQGNNNSNNERLFYND